MTLSRWSTKPAFILARSARDGAREEPQPRLRSKSLAHDIATYERGKNLWKEPLAEAAVEG
jgi:hypothetical protein